MNKPGTGSTIIGQAQTLLGQFMVFGGGLKIPKHQDDPYRSIDDKEVFLVNKTNIDHDLVFKRSSLRLWGKFYHPYLMNGMPGAGGWNKLYAKLVGKHYVMWVSSKLDEDMVGPSDWVDSLWAWSPKYNDDTLDKATYRMFYAGALEMDGVADDDQYYTDSYDKESKWQTDWEYSEKCFQVLASIRKTEYTNDKNFDEVYKAAPKFLMQHLLNCRLQES